MLKERYYRIVRYKNKTQKNYYVDICVKMFYSIDKEEFVLYKC